LNQSNIRSILAGMTTPSADVTAALARLRERWGAAAPRPAGEVIGALATVPLADPDPGGLPGVVPPVERELGRVFSTGFGALDAILGPGGLPRGAVAAFRGDLSSGRTTLALRLAAEAQAVGAIVAWLDLARSLDPVEAVSRGVRLEWLVAITPASLDEGLAIAGQLLAGRTVDLVVLDLPPRGSGDGARVGDRFTRLAALARRAGVAIVVLEPASAGSPGTRRAGTSGLSGAVAGAATLRLELDRRAWIRLGHDVVGQRTRVVVARNRAGPPGRQADLRILYAEGGDRDACLRRDGLLVERPIAAPINAPLIPVPGNRDHATAPPLSPAPPPRSHPAPDYGPRLRLMAGGSGRPRRPALVERDGPRRGPVGPGARRPAGDAARGGAPAGPGSDLPRSRAGG